MKNQLILALGLLSLPATGQHVIVNPDGTHSVQHGSVIVNPDGTHSTIHGSVIVNPNGTHSVIHKTGKDNAVIVNPDGSHSIKQGSVIVNPNGTHTLINKPNANSVDDESGRPQAVTDIQQDGSAERKRANKRTYQKRSADN